MCASLLCFPTTIGWPNRDNLVLASAGYVRRHASHEPTIPSGSNQTHQLLFCVVSLDGGASWLALVIGPLKASTMMVAPLEATFLVPSTLI